MAADLKKEIKAKYCDRLQLLFNLSSAKSDTSTNAKDLQRQRLALARGISKLKDLEDRLDKNVVRSRDFSTWSNRSVAKCSSTKKTR
jgi:hypothetical protein